MLVEERNSRSENPPSRICTQTRPKARLKSRSAAVSCHVESMLSSAIPRRFNMRHNCVFHGLKLVNTAVYRDYSENRARYSEKVEISRTQPCSPPLAMFPKVLMS